MPLQAIVNSIVFSPPENGNTLQTVQLLQHKQYMDFVRKASGQQIAYYHMAPGGGRVTEDRLAEVTRTATVMLFHHGNAEDLSGCYHYAGWLAASFGISVIMYDYCGYGLSGRMSQSGSGSVSVGSRVEISEKTVYSDADDMYAHVLKLGYPAHRIIIVGRSVGGGPACYLAQKHHKDIAGLILISTFTSCLRVVSSCFLPYFCCCVDLFPNYRRVEAAMECPMLIMHGTNDNVVPHHCSCELLDTVDECRSAELRRLLRRRKRVAAEQDPLSVKSNNNSASEPRASTYELGCPPADGEADSVFDLYSRAYAAVPERVRELAAEQVGFGAHEVQIGVFHRWLPGCGHNDIEAREMKAFAQALMWFVRFAKAFSTERGSVGKRAKTPPGVAASRE